MNRAFIAFGALFTGALPLLIDSTLKGAILLLVAAMGVLILRKVSAAIRHFVWLFALSALFALPILSASLPRWAVLPRLNTAVEKSTSKSNPAQPFQLHLDHAAVVAKAGPPATSSDASVLPIAAKKSFHVRDWLPLVWMTGLALFVMRLAAAHWVLGRARDRCNIVRDGRLAEAKEDAWRRLNIHRPVQLLLDSHRSIPVTWGVFLPHVLLPAEAADWDDTRLRAVLLHEMAHIKRGDALALWLAQLSCALHWFNPLAWFAAWRLRVESERACDDLVLANGVRASDYAEHLLHVATTLSSARMMQTCGLAMACSSGMERRLLAVLNQRANRRSVTRGWALAVLTLGFCVLIPVAMVCAASEKTLSATEDPATTVVAAGTNSPLPGTSPVKPSESADTGKNETNRIKLLRAETNLQRATELRGQNLISETEFNKARTEMEIARAELAGLQDEVARIKLRDAKNELARLTELQNANLVSKETLDQAKYKVALLRAEARGDEAEAARVRFRQTESELKRASQLRQQNLISETEYNDARQQLELCQAELRQFGIDGSATTSSTQETEALLKARDEARAKAEAAQERMSQSGKDPRVGALGFASARKLRDQQAASGSTVEAYKRYAETAREIEEKIQKDVELGGRSPLEADIARFERLQADVDLARVEGRLPAEEK